MGPSRKGYRAPKNSVPNEREVPVVRVLVAIAPRSYREAVALYIHRHRPQAEVSIVSPAGVDAEVGRSSSHLVVCNEASEGVREAAITWIRILFESSLGAEVSIYGRCRRFEDVGMEDLLEVFDRTEALLSKGDGITLEGARS